MLSFPATHVVVEKKATGKRWSVAVERIMDLIDKHRLTPPPGFRRRDFVCARHGRWL